MGQFAFLVIFLFLSNYFQVLYFLINLIRPSKQSRGKNKKILLFLKNKVDLNLKDYRIIKSSKMFGGMSGLPGKPFLLLSSKLLKTLNQSELEYVLLHEAAHNKYGHPFLVALSQITLVHFGLYLSNDLTLISSIFIAVILSLLFIQLARLTERQAEIFAAKRISGPRSMVSAVGKFKLNWGSKNLWFRKYFSWNISYEEKIEIANKYR